MVRFCGGGAWPERAPAARNAMAFKELDIVLVRALQTSTRPVDGSELVRRQPRVGGRGIVVHVLGLKAYVVECVDEDGRTVWLADFHDDELALVQ